VIPPQSLLSGAASFGYPARRGQIIASKLNSFIFGQLGKSIIIPALPVDSNLYVNPVWQHIIADQLPVLIVKLRNPKTNINIKVSEILPERPNICLLG
jgi:hypothetical protein